MSAAPIATGTSIPARSAGRASFRSRMAARAERHGGPEVTRRDLPGGDRGRDRPDRQPAASAHLADRHEVLEVGERLLADELPRPQVLDRRERLLLAGREDLGDGRRPDPGSVSSSSAVARLRSIGPDAPPGRPGAAPPPDAAGPFAAASSREGTRMWSPSRSGAARLSSRPARSVSTRGPYPPAASTRSPIRAPAGSSEDTRLVDRPDDLDDEDAARDRRRRTPPGCDGPTRADDRQRRTAVDDDQPARRRPGREHERPDRERNRGDPDDERGPLDGPPRRRFGTAGRRARGPARPDPRGRATASRSDPRIDLPGGMVGRRRRGVTRRLATLGALPTRRDVVADFSDAPLTCVCSDLTQDCSILLSGRVVNPCIMRHRTDRGEPSTEHSP